MPAVLLVKVSIDPVEDSEIRARDSFDSRHLLVKLSKKGNISMVRALRRKRLLSLFSGCGGMDIGFEGGFYCLEKSINTKLHPDWIEKRQGDFVLLRPTFFDTVFANDIRPDAKAAWVGYFSSRKEKAEEIYRLGSIVDLVKKAKNGEKVFPDNVDIVTGGFPCQDFSVAGKRLGFRSHKSHNGKLMATDAPTNESRGNLYMWMRDVITLTSPKMFVAENVKGLINLDDAKGIIERDFATAGGSGYLVVPARPINAADYGVPQSRERVIFFGFRKDALQKDALIAFSSAIIPSKYDPVPEMTHGISAGAATVTCADAFVGLTEPEDSDDPSQRVYSKAKFMGKHCQGQTEVRLAAPGPTIRSEHHGNIEFRRLDAKHGGSHFDELLMGLPERRLTVRECARIQTFPDDYLFVQKKKGDLKAVSASDAYKIIGNAVPCVMAYCIAKNIEKKWSLYFKSREK